MKSPEQFQQEAEQKTEFYKDLQDQVALLDAEQVDYGNGAVQAGERNYPEPPLPLQHLDKPGEEAI